MATCPHCGSVIDRRAAKGLSGPAIPLRCAKCGGLSSIGGWRLGVLGAVAGIGGAGVVLSTVTNWSWIPFVALIAIPLVTPLAIPSLFPLTATNERRVLRDRLFLGGILGVLAIGAVMAGFGL
jgi:hypothetical protein